MSDQDPLNPAPPPSQPIAPPVQEAGYPRPANVQPQQNDALQALIPTKNPPALVSYYVGVASLICIFAPILSPISIYFGVKAMRMIKEQPGLPGKGHAITGFVLSGFSLAVFLFLLVVILMSSKVSSSSG